MASKAKHIAIILDGNRRYAKKLGVAGVERPRAWNGQIKGAFDWCMELRIKELTLYAFSTENFNRSKDEMTFCSTYSGKK